MEKKKYQCVVCGEIVETEGELPADFVCPVCGVDASNFVEVDN